MQTYVLTDEFIELNALLKLLGIAPSGGAAKAMILEEQVQVDGVTELRIRRKLYAGAVVQVLGEQIQVVAAPGA